MTTINGNTYIIIILEDLGLNNKDIIFVCELNVHGNCSCKGMSQNETKTNIVHYAPLLITIDA